MRADLAWLTESADAEKVTADLFRVGPEAGAGTWWVAFTARARYAYLLGKRGESARSASLTAEAEESVLKKLATGTRSVELVELAGLRLLRGDRAGALESLARAYASGARDYGFLEADPMFGAIRSDPGFRTVIERMKADVAAQRQRAAERGLLDIASLTLAGRSSALLPHVLTSSPCEAVQCGGGHPGHRRVHGA